VVAVLATGALGAAGGTAVAQPSGSSPAFNSLTAGQAHMDWMSSLPDSASLAALSVPGTHDTLAIHGGLAPWAYEAQEDHGDSAGTLDAQFASGIRAVDIRVRVVNDGTAFAIHHTDVYQHANFDDVLAHAKRFLTAHPGETILMSLSGECDANSSEGGSGISSVGHCADDPASTRQSDRIHIFRDYLARYPGLFYAPTVSGGSAATMPSLGQVRGHIVLGAFKGPRGGIYAGYGLTQLTAGYQDSYTENDWSECDTAQKWDEARANISAASADSSAWMYTTYLSANCAPLGPGPATMAGGGLFTTGVNERALDDLGSGGAAELNRTGVVMMDYPGSGLISAIINHNYPQISVVSLRAHANGEIVTAENQGKSYLIANRTAIGLWEEFDLVQD
jgi:1-phosphatidylinositol phosphodiesterase